MRKPTAKSGAQPKPSARIKASRSAAEAFRRVSGGWTPIDNWRGSSGSFEPIYTRIRDLAGFRYSDSLLREVDVVLQIRFNVAQAAARKRAEAGRFFARFSPSDVGRAIGKDRKVVREAFRVLVTAGLHEERQERGRVLFRPRQIDRDRAEAYAAFLESAGGFPPGSWWDAGTKSPQSLTRPETPVTVGTKSPQGGDLVTSGVGESPHPNRETPRPGWRSASEEVVNQEEKVTVTPSPAPSQGSGSGGAAGPPAKRWPDAPFCYGCGAPLDAETLASDDPTVKGWCAKCRSM